MTPNSLPEQQPEPDPDQERRLIVKALFYTLAAEMVLSSAVDFEPVIDNFVHTSVGFTAAAAIGALAWSWVKGGD